ncbi:hypothetical protein A2U01_0034564, partial [Trifolium medium]|nr:hypothetical protein [Trifolium medium]
MQVVRLSVTIAPLAKPPYSAQFSTTLPRRGQPQMKPGMVYATGMRSSSMEQLRLSFSADGKVLEKLRANRTIDELSILLNPMVQIQDKLGAFVLANSFVDNQGHVIEYGLCMKLETCGHDVVVFKLDTYSKLCDHDVVNELNLITSIEFLSGPPPLSRDESSLLAEYFLLDDLFELNR